MNISIALATFNGSRFIQRQIESILSQTLLPNELIINDDCSDDNVLDNIKSYMRDDNPFFKISRNPVRLGFIKNFEAALRACSGDIIFICDQDDFWHPHKIERMTSMLGDSLLMHSDARLIDSEGVVITESYSKTKKKHPEYAPFERILDDNCITGCTTVIKRKLIELSPPFPDKMPHDQWLALLAADKGKLTYLPEILTDYRQHDFNLLGAGDNSNQTAGINLSKIKLNRNKHRIKADYLKNILQSAKSVINSNDKSFLIDMIAYHEGMSKKSWGLSSTFIHAKHFRFINYRDPPARRMIKLLQTPLRSMFG